MRKGMPQSFSDGITLLSWLEVSRALPGMWEHNRHTLCERLSLQPLFGVDQGKDELVDVAAIAQFGSVEIPAQLPLGA